MTSLFISEYIEGSSNNKAIELYNPTGASIDLSSYALEFYFNGSSSAGTTINLTGTIVSGDVFIIADDGADPTILAEADLTPSNSFFNGDDAVVLRNNGNIVDAFGQIGVDPGSSWPGGGQNVTLRRQSSITTGDTNANDLFDASIEWVSFPNDTFDGLGSHTVDTGGGTNLAIAATDADKAEGDAGTTPLTFTVTRSGDTTDTTSVDFTLSGDVDGADFGGTLPADTVTFAAGETSQVIALDVSGDTDIEPNETFTVTLSNPSGGATITTATANGTIQNDDGVAFTPIYEIQGSGTSSPIVDQSITTTGVVTGDFQNGDVDDSRNLRGFYIQDVDGDGDSTTSDGIFVFESALITDVNVGDLVQISGTVNEFFGETQITASTVEVVGSGSVAPVNVDLPSVSTVVNSDDELIADLEQYEGMLVTFNDTLTVDEYFNYDRFGEIRLSEGDRPFQFTQTNAPSVAGYQAHLEDLARRTITLDDGLTVQNPDPLVFPSPEFSDSNNFRGGDTITGLTGNVRFSRGSGGSGDETYRIMPTETPNFVSENPRPNSPENVDGRLKVVSFNVLNYFTTIDTSGATTANGSDPRGADNQDEFNRQTQKLVTTILELDADILGLVELENDFLPGSNGNAIENLVNELNAVAGADTYDWVNPGQQFVDVGDAISVGMIYKTASVEITAGTTPAILTDSNLPTGFAGETIFNGVSTNRAPLAVSFTETATGETLTIAVNHFKSKGSVFNDGNNADIGDGQGNNNPIRLRAAQAVDAWLQSDPTGSGDSDFLILGDLNAYANEDPVTYLEGAGYTDLAEQFSNGVPYSYLFDGQLGTLDYALANSSLLSQVTGATEWHVNADEADALDYNLDFGRNPDLFNGDNSFRNSDHDPLIVGLDLSSSGGATPGDDNLVGTRNDDTIDALAGNDIVIGRNGDDQLLGNDDNDRLIGNRGQDTLIGGAGNDTVVGSLDDDVLIGVDPDAMTPGLGERDVLRGYNDSDRFILGDSDTVYYIGEGNLDRAVIRDFEPGTDVIVLPGNFEDYIIRVNRVGSTIIRDASRDLIAVVRQAALTESDFEFIVD